MGSPLYMSPEQLRSAKYVDARTDIWALGSILFELVAGAPAFDGTTLPEVCSMILTAEPHRLRERCPHAPEGLEQVVARALAREVDERYPDLTAFSEDLAPFGGEDAALSLSRIRRYATVKEGAATAAATERLPEVAAPTDSALATVAQSPGAAPGVEAQPASDPLAASAESAAPSAGAALAAGPVLELGASGTPAVATEMSGSVTVGKTAAEGPPTRRGGALVALVAIAALAIGGLVTAAVMGQLGGGTAEPGALGADPPAVDVGDTSEAQQEQTADEETTASGSGEAEGAAGSSAGDPSSVEATDPTAQAAATSAPASAGVAAGTPGARPTAATPGRPGTGPGSTSPARPAPSPTGAELFDDRK
jgi:serine/threonine-protein kinase